MSLLPPSRRLKQPHWWRLCFTWCLSFCLSVCLFIGLLTTSSKNCWSDLQENLTGDVLTYWRGRICLLLDLDPQSFWRICQHCKMGHFSIFWLLSLEKNWLYLPEYLIIDCLSTRKTLLNFWSHPYPESKYKLRMHLAFSEYSYMQRPKLNLSNPGIEASSTTASFWVANALITLVSGVT